MPIVDVAGKPLCYLHDTNSSVLGSLYGDASKVIESGYVQKGLALWLDGEFNAGKNVHEQNPSVWKDLSGNGYDFTLNAVTVSDKAMAFDGTSSYGRCENGALKELLSGLKERTIEVVCKFNNTSSAQVVFLGEGMTEFPSNEGAAGLWYRPTSSESFFKAGTWSKSPTIKAGNVGQFKSYSVVYDDKNLSDIAVYQNNASLTQDAVAGNMYNEALSIGARLKNDDKTWQYLLNGEICCIRVYDRRLTDRERYYNYLIDKMRFSFKASNELTVMSFNVQNWTKLNSDETLISSILKKYNPDVVGFQEYDTSGSLGGVPIKDYLNDIWEFVEVGVPSSRTYSKAIVSHRETTPIETMEFTTLSPNTAKERLGYHKTYIEVNGKRIAVFNTHMDVSDSKNSEGVPYKYFQAKELCEIVSKEEYFILLGDFNTTCDSIEHEDYINQLKPFVDAGFNLTNCCAEFGFNNTWTDSATTDAGRWLPTDNIITSASISVNSIAVDTQKIEANTDGQLLDHMPLIAYLTVN